MEVHHQVVNNHLLEVIMECVWLVRVVMVHQAVVILVAMDVRTTFHPVIQVNISSTVAGTVVHHRVQGGQVSNLKEWARPVLKVRGPPIIPLGRRILRCRCRNKWAKVVILVLIVTTGHQTTMDRQGHHRACSPRQILVIPLVLIRTLRLHRRTDIRQTVSVLNLCFFLLIISTEVSLLAP